jgi:hypothetical protein
MASTESEVVMADRLARLEAELARVKGRTDLRESHTPVGVPSASAVFYAEREAERRAARDAATERQRQSDELWARADRPKREKRDRELAKLDAAMAEITEQRAQLSRQYAQLMLQRTALASSLQPPQPPAFRPMGGPADWSGWQAHSFSAPGARS